MITNTIAKSVAKFVVAVALTIAMITGSGVVAEQVGLDVTSNVYAGNCATGAGGGC